MHIQTKDIVAKANRLVKLWGTRDPKQLADTLNIEIVPCDFQKQRGAYKVIMKQPFIFIKNDLHPVMERIVLLHEIGHDRLHRNEAVAAGGFKEFEIFDMRDKRMEYEANIFAAQISLPDEEILDYIVSGYDVGQIAKAMNSDMNLVALKVAELNSRGYQFRELEHRSNFLSGKHIKQVQF